MGNKCGPLALVVSGMLTLGAVSASAAPRAQTIRLFETDSVFVGTGGFPTGNAPPAVGQGFVTTGTLYKSTGGKQGAPTGHVRVVCTVTSVTLTKNSGTAWTQCEVSLFLPGGVIEGSGPLSLANPTNEIPVIGGTGAYVGAQGVVKHTNIGDQNSNRSTDVIEIVS